MRFHKIASALVACTCLVAVATPSAAQQISFTIPAGSLKSALDTYARQARRAVIYKADDVRGAVSPGFRGTGTPSQVLDALLANSGFSASPGASGAVAIVRGNGPSAQVQTADASSTDAEGGEEIIVTANKQGNQRLIDVPLAVSAVNTDRLVQTGAVRLEDFSATVPGVAVANNAAGGVQTQVVFRGISTGAGGNPISAAYIDDAPITSATLAGGGNSFPDFDPSDLERIEFLRGPQGTLYGAASLGGLVRYVTRKPDFDTLSGRAELDLSSVAHGNQGGGVRARVNVPINDKIAFTASGFYRLDPGFIDNRLNGKKDINGGRYRGGRVAVAFKPSENVTVRGSILHQRIDIDAVTTTDVDSSGKPLFGTYEVSRPPRSSRMKARFTIYDLAVEGEFGGVQLTSDTSYSINNAGTAVDYTKLVGSLVDGLAGTPAGTIGVDIYQPYKSKKFSQEVRLQSTGDGFFGWQVGGFYTRENARYFALVEPLYAISGAPADGIGLPDLGTALQVSRYEEIAGFGTITLKFTPRFSVAGGLRYSHIETRLAVTNDGLLLGTSMFDGTSSDNQLTFSINPVYRVTPNFMVYGRVASGYRPGGANVFTPAIPTFSPDTVVSYEIGAKGELFNRMLTLDVAAFLIDWKDIQVRQTTTANGGIPLNYTANAGKARSQGVEAAVVLRPVHGLTFNGNLAYTDAAFRTTTAIAPAGARLPTTPKWSGQVGFEYRFDTGSDWSPFVGASYRYVGRRLGEFAAAPGGPRFVMPSYETVDLRAGAEYRGFEVTAFVRNVADKYGVTGAFDLGPYSTVSLLQPRTFGLSLAKSF